MSRRGSPAPVDRRSVKKSAELRQFHELEVGRYLAFPIDRTSPIDASAPGHRRRTKQIKRLLNRCQHFRLLYGRRLSMRLTPTEIRIYRVAP